MPDIRDLPKVVHRRQQRLVEHVQGWASNVGYVLGESGGGSRHVRTAEFIDKAYDLAGKALENQRGLAKALLASGDSASEALREQAAYQRRFVKRAASAGARMSADRALASRQTTHDNVANLRVTSRRQRGAVVQTTMHSVETVIEAITAGVKGAGEIARDSVTDARETLLRQQTLAKKISRENLDATRVVLGLSMRKPPTLEPPAPTSEPPANDASIADSEFVDYSGWAKAALVEEASRRGLATFGTVRDLRTRLALTTKD